MVHTSSYSATSLLKDESPTLVAQLIKFRSGVGLQLRRRPLFQSSQYAVCLLVAHLIHFISCRHQDDTHQGLLLQLARRPQADQGRDCRVLGRSNWLQCAQNDMIEHGKAAFSAAPCEPSGHHTARVIIRPSPPPVRPIDRSRVRSRSPRTARVSSGLKTESHALMMWCSEVFDGFPQHCALKVLGSSAHEKCCSPVSISLLALFLFLQPHTL